MSFDYKKYRTIKTDPDAIKALNLNDPIEWAFFVQYKIDVYLNISASPTIEILKLVSEGMKQPHLYSYACAFMAMLYKDGIGVKKDDKLELKYAQISCDLDNVIGRYIVNNGWPDDVTEYGPWCLRFINSQNSSLHGIVGSDYSKVRYSLLLLKCYGEDQKTVDIIDRVIRQVVPTALIPYLDDIFLHTELLADSITYITTLNLDLSKYYKIIINLDPVKFKQVQCSFLKHSNIRPIIKKEYYDSISYMLRPDGDEYKLIEEDFNKLKNKQ